MNSYSFEKEEDLGFKSVNSTIELSSKHYKDGKNSLLWKLEDDQSKLILDKDIGYTPFVYDGTNYHQDCFAIWVYLEEKMPGKTLKFEFLKENDLCAHFNFNLDFTGWRTAWVPYVEMEGQAQADMDQLIIRTDISKPSSIYLDQMILAKPISPRHPTRDKQVPFVNIGADEAVNSHWLSLYKFDSLKEKAFAEKSQGQVKGETLDLLRSRYESHLLDKSTYGEKTLKDLKDFYDSLEIEIKDGNIKGRTIDVNHHKEIYPEDEKEKLIKLADSVDIGRLSEWMLDLAYRWVEGEDKEALEDMFVKTFRHLLDQGWAYGSAVGTVHHLGYPMRDYYSALFLMREPLENAGFLEEAIEAMGWYSGVGRIFREDDEFVGESMDTFNTLLQGILGSILMMENKKEIHKSLLAIENWINISLLPTPGLRGPFKVDGSVYHHCNHYPAYAMGGFEGIAPLVYFLSQTEYEIQEESHSLMRKALLLMRVYCNHYNWPVSMSARHPTGTSGHAKISSLDPFYYMALTGEPGNTKEIDAEVAEALLRLAKYMDYPRAQEFTSKGYKAEEDPRGNYTMNYASANLHRRDHWLAAVRGHSRYLWANESYVRNNLYGRYIGHGNLQILSGGKPVNNTDSGFFQEGWDWNCWPGTTAIHLPIDQVKSDVRNVDDFSGYEEMLLSDETFAGGLSLKGENGMYAMKLHEHAKYDGSHRARKSYFFFDNKIVCLGSDIENTDEINETRTCLFQNYLKQEDELVVLKDKGETRGLDTDYSNDEKTYIYDNIGNTYYISQGQKLRFTRTMQESRDQNTTEPTFAPFAKAWIDHGTNPSKEEYEYMIAVDEKPREEYLADKPYKVLQKDFKGHVIFDKASKTTAYSLFEKDNVLDYANLIGVERPALVMEQEKEDLLSLSICDPDLRLYEGIEEDQYNPDGSQKEVSVYSRDWLKNPSKGMDLQVKLKGKWKAKDKDLRLDYKDGNTILTVYCVDAMPVEVELSKVK